MGSTYLSAQTQSFSGLGVLKRGLIWNNTFLQSSISLRYDHIVVSDLQVPKGIGRILNRKRKTGTVLQRKMLKKHGLFQQDGAPAHNAKITQDWLGGRINKFWVKGTWPANSPDLSLIENLWSILKNDLDSMGGLKDLKTLETQLKTAWSNISPEILGNLMDGMQNRIKKCIELKGGYIGK